MLTKIETHTHTHTHTQLSHNVPRVAGENWISISQQRSTTAQAISMMESFRCVGIVCVCVSVCCFYCFVFPYLIALFFSVASGRSALMKWFVNRGRQFSNENNNSLFSVTSCLQSLNTNYHHHLSQNPSKI
jgi:hypothetical protein